MADEGQGGVGAASRVATAKLDGDALVLCLPRLSIAVVVDSADLRYELLSTFSGLAGNGPADERWVVKQDDEAWSVTAPGKAIDGRRSVSTASLVGRLQTELNNLVTSTSCAAGDVLLHAGTLMLDSRTVLLVGTSGAGKTTLTATLVDGGARYLSDEFAVLEPGARLVRSYGKPLTVKQGAREAVARLGLFADSTELHESEPGLRYVPVPAERVVFEAPWPSLLVLLDADPEVEPGWLHPAEVLIALAEHSPCREQTTEQFPRLADLAREVRAYQLPRDEPARMAATVHELLTDLDRPDGSDGSPVDRGTAHGGRCVEGAEVSEAGGRPGSGERLERAAAVLTEDFGDATVLYDPHADRLHLLNAAGRALWFACNGQHSADELVSSRSRLGFDAADVQQALAVFRREGLLADASTVD